MAFPYALHVLPHAERDIKKIFKAAPVAASLIAAEIRQLPSNPRPEGSRAVVGQKDLHRIHAAKRYRVIYGVLDRLQAVIIVTVRVKGESTYKNIPVADLSAKIQELDKGLSKPSQP